MKKEARKKKKKTMMKMMNCWTRFTEITRTIHGGHQLPTKIKTKTQHLKQQQDEDGIDSNVKLNLS